MGKREVNGVKKKDNYPPAFFFFFEWKPEVWWQTFICVIPQKARTYKPTPQSLCAPLLGNTSLPQHTHTHKHARTYTCRHEVGQHVQQKKLLSPPTPLAPPILFPLILPTFPPLPGGETHNKHVTHFAFQSVKESISLTGRISTY